MTETVRPVRRPSDTRRFENPHLVPLKAKYRQSGGRRYKGTVRAAKG